MSLAVLGADLWRLFAHTPVPVAVLGGPQLVFEMANPAYLDVVGGREVLGKPLLEALPEARGQGFDELLREVMRTGVPHVGREVPVRLERKGAVQDTWFTFIYAPVRGADGAADRVIAIVNDVTEQVTARRGLEVLAAEVSRELAAAKKLQEMSTRLIGEDDVEAFYGAILDAAVDIMGSQYASIQMLYPERGELRLLGFRGFNAQAAKFWEWVRPASESTCGMALRTRERCVVPDVERCEFMAGSEDLATYLQTGIRAVQTTPLLSRDGVLVGMISTHWREPHQPSERDLRLLDILARQAADAVERRIAQAALRASEQRYGTVLGLMPAAVYTCEAPGGRITYHNEHAARLWGRAPKAGDDDARFCGSYRLWRPDGTLLPHEETPMALALREGREVRNQEVVIERPDGSRITVLVNIDPLRDAQGRVTGAINVFHDISERKRMLEALGESEARFRAVIESQSEMLCRFRPDGTILFVNPAYARALGTTAEAMASRSFWDFIPEEDRPGVRAMLERLTPEAPEARIENRFETAAGERWTLWTNRALAFDADGRLLEAQSSGIDITDRKRVEAALREADRRKDEFLAMLSHELRNPLAPIRNAVNLLDEADDDPEMRAQARGILRRQVAHMIRLVDELLDMTRISRGEVSLQMRAVALADVVSSAVETSRPLIDARGHALEVGLPERPVWLFADAVRLAQVLSNLLNNAAKYTPRGGRIELSARAERGFAVISVRDNGHGIDPAELPSLFEMFTQSEATRRRAPGGLGIGLALAKQLVELHDGRIEGRSDGPGRGAEFTVRMPAVSPAGGARPRTEAVGSWSAP